MHINTRALLVLVDYLTYPKTTYYEWLMRFSKSSYPGLKDKKRSKPRMPNQIKLDLELIICNYITRYLAYGLKGNHQSIDFAKTKVLPVIHYVWYPLRENPNG